MQVDSALLVRDLGDIEDAARRIEALGYDGLYTFEGPHDPFFPLLLAARVTGRLRLATAIAVAFARTPMLLAHIGWDLQALSAGRFVLGLGSQIRPHIEKCYGIVLLLHEARSARGLGRLAVRVEGIAGARALPRRSRAHLGRFSFRGARRVGEERGWDARDDVVAPARAWSEDAVVPDEVKTRGRDAHREPFE